MAASQIGVGWAFIDTSLQEVTMAMVKDPVCGMMIDDKNAAGSSEYQGKRYHFCSKDCKQEFDENPEDYVNQA